MNICFVQMSRGSQYTYLNTRLELRVAQTGYLSWFIWLHCASYISLPS